MEQNQLIILAIHSTTPRLGLAITKDEKVLRGLILPPSREHLENAPLAIKNLTEAAGIRLEEVDGFGVATGPGSFSGIRVGLALVKGMALALQKPAVGVSSLAILARQATGNAEFVVPVIDARRHQVYTAVYGRDVSGMTMLEGPFLMELEKFTRLPARYPDPLVVCADRISDTLAESKINVVTSHVEGPSPAACAALAEIRLKRGDPGKVHALMPLYIRRSDAELNRSGGLSLHENT